MSRGTPVQGAIGFTIRECSLGRVIVAASERGICHVRFGDCEDELEDQLRGELPFATLERADVRLKAWSDVLVADIEGHAEGHRERHGHGEAASPRQLDGRRGEVDLPLDVAASRFQRRVWAALEQIPRGETRSYSDVAQAVGLPKGARAVARACATNPVAMLVPCHRAVSKDGGLGGYRWGVERKRMLLARERAGGGASTLEDGGC